MAFFDNIANRVSETGSSVMQKAREAGSGLAGKAMETADTVKTNLAISAEQKKINEIYQQIGMQYYYQHKEEPDAAFSEQIAMIAAGFEKIEEFKRQLQPEQFADENL